jgi:4'-phosphopantetheinyl transferase
MDPLIQPGPVGRVPVRVLSRAVAVARPVGEVHVHVADLDAGPADPAALAEADRLRAERLAVPQVARRFVAARGFLRTVLAAYRHDTPPALPIEADADGKPHLPGGPAFNLSHTGGLAVLAVADRPVGVDVERLRDVPNALDLADRWFRPDETRAVAEASDRSLQFLRTWVAKEAVLKAVGCGLRGLEGCAVDVSPGRPGVVRAAPDGRNWHLSVWRPDRDHIAAVCLVVPPG